MLNNGGSLKCSTCSTSWSSLRWMTLLEYKLSKHSAVHRCTVQCNGFILRKPIQWRVYLSGFIVSTSLWKSCKCFNITSLPGVYRIAINIGLILSIIPTNTVYPMKYAHGFVVLCFVVVMQSFIINSHEVFIHIIRVAFLALGQSLDCHSASEVSLMDMGKSVNV